MLSTITSLLSSFLAVLVRVFPLASHCSGMPLAILAGSPSEQLDKAAFTRGDTKATSSCAISRWIAAVAFVTAVLTIGIAVPSTTSAQTCMGCTDCPFLNGHGWMCEGQEEGYDNCAQWEVDYGDGPQCECGPNNWSADSDCAADDAGSPVRYVQSRVLDQVRAGRMLPSAGSYYYTVRGGLATLRRKCDGVVLGRVAMATGEWRHARSLGSSWIRWGG